MLRQTDGNWVAFFFLTDHHRFGVKLKKTLDGYRDNRLQYLHISKQFRPSVRDLLVELLLLLLFDGWWLG